MDMPAQVHAEPTLIEEFRSSMLLFALAIGTTGGAVIATRVLLRVLG